jgi:hypothetical protein
MRKIKNAFFSRIVRGSIACVVLVLTIAVLTYLLHSRLSTSQTDIMFALSNVALAILAIFGTEIHSWLFNSPDIELELHNHGRGEIVVTPNQGSNIRYYHFLLKNKKKNTVAFNAAAYLVGLSVPNSNGVFVPHVFPPIKMIWPYETANEGKLPRKQDIQREMFCDLCWITNTLNLGIPREIQSYRTIELLKDVKRVRLHIEVRADNFYSEEPSVFEINWNGKWAVDDDAMAENLKITIVKTT